MIFIFFDLHFNILFSYFLIKTSKSASRKPVWSDWQGGQHGSGIFVPKRGVQGLNANEAKAENRFFFLAGKSNIRVSVEEHDMSQAQPFNEAP